MINSWFLWGKRRHAQSVRGLFRRPWAAEDLLVHSEVTWRLKVSSYVLSRAIERKYRAAKYCRTRHVCRSNPADGKIYFTARVIQEEEDSFSVARRNRESPAPAIYLGENRAKDRIGTLFPPRIHRACPISDTRARCIVKRREKKVEEEEETHNGIPPR